MHNDTVSDIMTTNVIAIDRELDVSQAIETMRANGIRRLPVVSKTGRLIGLISLNDAMVAMPKGATGLGESFDPIPSINEVMQDYVYTVGPDATIAEAVRMMVNHKISCLPVVDDQKHVTGIVTESDIFRYLAGKLEAESAAG